MSEVPTSLAGLLSLLAPCFTQPTFQTFTMLLIGFVGRIRDCTITGMLQACGLAGVWHHSRAHDFFARRRWNPDELGLRLLDFLVVVFAKDGPLPLAVDDTLFGRSGRRVFGAHYLHDGAQPEGSGRRTRWGNCWVVVVLVVSLPCLGGRQVGLPVLFRLFEPKDDDHPDRASQPELGRALIDMVIKRFPRRTIELVMDGAFPSRGVARATRAGDRHHPDACQRARARARLADAHARPEGSSAAEGPKARDAGTDRQDRCLPPGHDHRPRRTPTHRARPRVHLPVVHAVLHPGDQGDPDPQPRHHRRVRRRARIHRRRHPPQRS
jgi:DDE superfamily endonuclease